MTAFLVRACRGVPRVLLSSLSRPSSCRCHNYGFLSFTPSSPSHFDFCKWPGRVRSTHLHHTGPFWSLGWRSLPQLRFYSVRGGGEEGKKCSNKEAEDEEELSAEDDGDEDGNESGDEDDGVQLVSESPPPLPVFKDSTEEAAYIGYKIVGSIKAGDFDRFKAPKAFAVVQVGSHQFKISPGDCIYTEKLKFADVNDKLSLEKVLLLGSKSQTIIGRPFVSKAFVHAAVEEQVLDAKVIIFKKKRRKNYRRTTGHRQELTRLRILEIRGLGEARSAVA